MYVSLALPRLREREPLVEPSAAHMHTLGDSEAHRHLSERFSQKAHALFLALLVSLGTFFFRVSLCCMHA